MTLLVEASVIFIDSLR